MDEHEAVENFQSAELQDDTPEIAAARAVQDEWLRTHGGFHDQDENGIDLSLIRSNLKLTPSERLDGLQTFMDSLSLMRCQIRRDS